MQGIVICGGMGTRLNLFSRRVSNKANVLVYNRLAFEYSINTLVRAGVTDLVLVVGYRYAGDLMNVIGDGKEFGITKLTYVYQKEAKGISDAIKQARGIIKDKCAVILSDNFFSMDISKYVDSFKTKNQGCFLFCQKVSLEEACKFGIAEVENMGISPKVSYLHVTDIIEKPKNPKSNLAVTGLYFYDNSLFDKIDKLSFSSRGELEITDLNMLYVAEGTANAYKVDGYWGDMGTYDGIFEAAKFVKENDFKLSYEIDAWGSDS